MTVADLSPKLKTNLWVHGRLVTLSAVKRINRRITITDGGWNLYLELRRSGFEPSRQEIRRALTDINLIGVEDGLVDLVQRA